MTMVNKIFYYLSADMQVNELCHIHTEMEQDRGMVLSRVRHVMLVHTN